MKPPVSRYAYGREKPATPVQAEQAAEQFLHALIIPSAWEFLGNTRCIDPVSGNLLSIGAVFRDMRTKGRDLTDYLICFIMAPQRGAICEKTIQDFGKYKYTTVISNKTAEDINKYIQEHY